MIAYLDTSVLVKRYIRETRTQEVQLLFDEAEMIAVSILTLPEVIAAVAKAQRRGDLWPNIATQVVQNFQLDWKDYHQLPVTEDVVRIAGTFAWDYQLRGYDAVNLATANLLHNSLQSSVVFATMDKRLWQAARQVGLEVWPQSLG